MVSRSIYTLMLEKISNRNMLNKSQLKSGIVCCLRRKPSDGGVVERPFGTFNSELFEGVPGYTGSDVSKRPPSSEQEACITLLQLEKLLVRYRSGSL